MTFFCIFQSFIVQKLTFCKAIFKTFLVPNEAVNFKDISFSKGSKLHVAFVLLIAGSEHVAYPAYAITFGLKTLEKERLLIYLVFLQGFSSYLLF